MTHVKIACKMAVEGIWLCMICHYFRIRHISNVLFLNPVCYLSYLIYVFVYRFISKGLASQELAQLPGVAQLTVRYCVSKFPMSKG